DSSSACKGAGIAARVLGGHLGAARGEARSCLELLLPGDGRLLVRLSPRPVACRAVPLGIGLRIRHQASVTVVLTGILERLADGSETHRRHQRCERSRRPGLLQAGRRHLHTAVDEGLLLRLAQCGNGVNGTGSAYSMPSADPVVTMLSRLSKVSGPR